MIETALSIPVGKHPAGEVFEYQSAQTQILTIALSRAVGESISSYANRELFAKAGFESAATWHLDQKEGLELGFCCVNASVRDYAKLGQLVLHHGNIDGQSVVDSSFLAMASAGYRSQEYGHGFWIYPEPHQNVFAFRGMLGQHIIVDPVHNRIVARVGHQSGGKFAKEFNLLETTLLAQMDRWDNN
ncbi:MAG: Uncharacterised protein [Flavobacteriales bacterium UBA4585]|nr:MAG: Uncharacterised protein [Flavobacteriales bacterium UBA4585]